MNHQLEQLSESFTIAFADRVRRLKAEGVPVIGLQTGDPDFNTPQPIIAAAHEAMQAGFTHYSNSRGLPALRASIAERMSREHGATFDPMTEILVTHGAIHAYYVGLQAILNPSEQVLVPDPTWQTHANMVRVLRGEPIRVPALAENGFLPTLDSWQAALTDKTTAIIINYPSNPTGAIAPREYLQQLVDFAVANNLYILSDEVYDSLLYDGNQHTCVATLDGAKDRTLVLNSFSKTYAMTGWRIGYLCAPEKIIDNALKASQHSITNVAEFLQRAAIVALTDAAVQQEMQTIFAAFAKRRAQVLAIYDRMGTTPIEITPPQGAFYFFIDGRKLGIPATEIAERILNEANVAVVPGAVYGAQGEGFLRMTTAASDDDITAGFTKILEWAAKQ